jgi:hypothetical protein
MDFRDFNDLLYSFDPVRRGLLPSSYGGSDLFDRDDLSLLVLSDDDNDTWPDKGIAAKLVGPELASGDTSDLLKRHQPGMMPFVVSLNAT